MNMRALKKSRKPPQPGDIFAFQVQDGEFMFGRVISVNMKMGSFSNVIILYIYKARSPGKEQIPVLDRNDLLIPPVATTDALWYQGYFETVARLPLQEDDRLETHCFASSSILDASKVRYYDEHGNQLRERMEPCGIYALMTFSGIDKKISEALGIPVTEEY